MTRERSAGTVADSAEVRERLTDAAFFRGRERTHPAGRGWRGPPDFTEACRRRYSIAP